MNAVAIDINVPGHGDHAGGSAVTLQVGKDTPAPSIDIPLDLNDEMIASEMCERNSVFADSCGGRANISVEPDPSKCVCNGVFSGD